MKPLPRWLDKDSWYDVILTSWYGLCRVPFFPCRDWDLVGRPSHYYLMGISRFTFSIWFYWDSQTRIFRMICRESCRVPFSKRFDGDLVRPSILKIVVDKFLMISRGICSLLVLNVAFLMTKMKAKKDSHENCDPARRASLKRALIQPLLGCQKLMLCVRIASTTTFLEA